MFTMFASVSEIRLSSDLALTRLSAVLTPYFPKAKIRKEHNLLSGQQGEGEVEEVVEVGAIYCQKPGYTYTNLGRYYCPPLVSGTSFSFKVSA